MTSSAQIFEEDGRYLVREWTGIAHYTYGPYRYRWWAKFMAWWLSGIH